MQAGAPINVGAQTRWPRRVGDLMFPPAQKYLPSFAGLHQGYHQHVPRAQEDVLLGGTNHKHFLKQPNDVASPVRLVPQRHS
jgi:hypothetical protein